MKERRHELRARLGIEGERMKLDLFRTEDDQQAMIIKGANGELFIVGKTVKDIKDTLDKSSKLIKESGL